MFTKAKAVVDVCGDYVAWHGMNFYTTWIFGDILYYEDDIPYIIEKKFNIDWNKEEPLSEFDKEELDKIVEEYFDSESRDDYHDFSIQDVLLEQDNNGNIVKVYLEI